MADHMIHLTDDEELAFAARVVWIQEQSEMVPPVFPPVTPMADVDALLMSCLEPNILQTVQWYLSQAG